MKLDIYEGFSEVLYQYKQCEGKLMTKEWMVSGCMKTFTTFEAAVEKAKNTAFREQRDVEIWEKHAVAKFPLPEIQVVTLDTPAPAEPAAA
jgi:hypothetical protein